MMPLRNQLEKIRLGKGLGPDQGFTFIELALVLVIIGLLLSLGVGAWLSLKESREVAKTRSSLQQVRNCLLKRMSSTLQYPSFSDDLTCSSDASSSHSVDVCLCPRKDAWGNKIVYLQGFDTDNDPLKGEGAVTSSYRGTQFTSVNSRSSVNATQGRIIHRVAFVLISPGKDGEFDSLTYGDFFDDDKVVGTLNATAEPPNFTQEMDDQYLVVTGPQIRTRLAE